MDATGVELDVIFTLTREQKGCFALLFAGLNKSLAKHCQTQADVVRLMLP